MSKNSLKFIVVGLSNTGLTYLVFLLFIRFTSLNVEWSLASAYLVGILNSYIWNRNWTFKSNQSNVVTSLVKFVTVYLVTYLINLALLSAMLKLTEWNALICQAIALILTTFLSYLGHKHWSFKSTAEVSND